jgi:long-subunit acyl-CoA synthetase (AMP-forming)
LISIRNSRDAVRHLLSISNSSHLIVDKHFHGFAQSLELDIPTVDFYEISLSKEEEEIALDFEEITQEQRTKEMELPAFYLHTSGSTGHPKIVGFVRCPITFFGSFLSSVQTHKVAGAWIDTSSRDIPLFERVVQISETPLYHVSS